MSDTEATTDGVELKTFVQPYRRSLIVGSALLLLTNLLDKAIPWLLQQAIDGLERGDLEVMKRSAIIVVALAAGLWIVRTGSRVVVFNVGRDVEHDLRNEVMRRVHRLGPTFFRSMPVGEVMSRATNDLAQVRLFVGFGALNLVNSIFAFGGALVLMIALSPTLTLWALLPYPAVVFIARFFGKRIYARSRDAQSALGQLADAAQENLAGVRVVRAFSLEESEKERFEEINQRAVDANMRLVVLRGVMWPVFMLVASIGTLIVIWKGGEMVLNDELTIGKFAAFNAYLAQLVWPTLAFGYLLSIIQRGRASFERVTEILDAEDEIEESAAPKSIAGRGDIEVRSLNFAYGETPILKDVSFHVPAEGSLAIMGTVGSGKSTLAALLPRLIDAPKESVFLDSVDVTEARLGELRDAIAYAQQEPFLFSTTVRQNIAFSMEDPGASDAEERIERACREACVWDEIQLLPKKLETLVGERGVQLSGGQKQRIALARALLSEPKVLVLDDPMSAVDAKTEATILEAIDRAKEGRTLILVTHRIAAASRADQIIVLDRGHILESGTHEELVQIDGVYASMARRQSIETELSTL